MGTPKLLPCPFCGGRANPVGGWTVDDGSPVPACEGCGAAAASVEAWNRRSDRAGHIAGLREAEAKAREFREHWSCAGGFGGHSAAARIIADTLSARITALEEEGQT